MCRKGQPEMEERMMEDMRSVIKQTIGDESFAEWFCNRDGKVKIIVREGMKDMETSIEDLNLSVRSLNCLRRAGYDTINSLVAGINGREDLMKIRNMGKKSLEEIMLKLFLFTYANLKPEDRGAYLSRIKRINAPKYECTV